MTSPGRTLLWNSAALVCLLVIGISVLNPALGSGFVLVDDHEILRFTPGVRSSPELRPMPDLVTQVVVADAGGGRFRPLYWAIRYGESALLGINPTAWHALYVAMGVVAAWLLYLALSAANVRGVPALLASVWLLVQPGVSSVWIRLGPQESLGTLLLLVGALAAARGSLPRSWAGWDWIFVIGVSAAALTKESFALVPPAMFGLRLLLFGLQGGMRAVFSRRALAPGLIALSVGLVVVSIAFNVARLSQAGSYGGGFLGTASIALDDTTRTNLEVLTYAGGIFMPVLVLGPIFDIWRWRRLTPETATWLAGAGVVWLLIVPQLVLYRRFGGFTIDRYVLPAGLGLVAGIAAALAWSQRLNQRKIVVVVVTAWLVLLSLNGLLTWRTAEIFRADSAQLSRMMAAVSEAPLGATIVVAADPVLDLEKAVSVPYHLAARGRPDLDTRVLLTPSTSPGAAAAVDAFAMTYFPGRTDASARGCASVAAVVLLASETAALDAMPCLGSGEFHLDSFTETVSVGSWVPLNLGAFITPVTARYSLLRR